MTGAVRAFFISGFDWNGATGRATVVVGLVTVALITLAGPPISAALDGRLSPAQVMFVLSALVCVQVYGTMVRRLHDAGRSGWWILLAIIPYGPILLTLALLALPSHADGGQRHAPTLARRIGFVLACGLALVMLSRGFWTSHLIVSDSMEPTLIEGDYVSAATLTGAPGRGDVVLYTYDAPGDPTQIMRVIALAGETVSVADGGLAIDGTPVAMADGRETLPDGTSHAILPATPVAEALAPAEAEVPEDHVFVLADNRDRDGTLANPQLLATRMVPISRTRAEVTRVVLSSDDWRSGVLPWISAMRWPRVGRPVR
ncbi:prokaryotic type I signal peptidase [Oceanicola granulosus HTCC2516]|uniref:Signal peptidase I n=2 Tax=Oceanicola granulosus TaxID=252302 RepID=Q2CCQ1_OCEGH|nr:prokaryotic type I signal peptidase [Oceanicola granulosus HTCC2516]